MKKQELLNLVNNSEVFTTLDDARGYLFDKEKLEPIILETFVDYSGPFSLSASDIYKCEDGFVEIRGILRILDEDKAKFLKECEAFEYNVNIDRRKINLPSPLSEELPNSEFLADIKSKEYRNYREESGLKDPVYLDEIENSYYNGAIWMKEYVVESISRWLKRKLKNYSSGDKINSVNLIEDFNSDFNKSGK